MRFCLDADVVALRDGVAAYLAKACPPDTVRAAWDAGGGPAGAPGLWSGLAEMGVLGMLAPEASGGAGLGQVAAAAVLAEAGRVAAPLPLAETVAVVVPALVGAGDPEGILPGVVGGEVVVAVASDVGAPAAGCADWFVLGSPPALHHREGVVVEARRSVDRTRDLAAVRATSPGTALPVPTGPGPTVADLGALAAAAVLIGLGHGMLAQTVAYVKERRQFGVPIGSFQAVKHRLADTLVGLELAAPTVWAAAHDVDVRSAHAGRSISLAKAMASDAATAAARTALQAHGAMGYTDDHHLHLWLKRTWCLAADHGTSAWHRSRIAWDLGLAGSAPAPAEVGQPTGGGHP